MPVAEPEPPPVVSPLVIRRSGAGWWGGLFGAVLIGAVAALMLVFAVAVLAGGSLLGLLLLVLAVVLVVLFLTVLRDTRGKTGWRIALGPEGLDLALPRGRSLAHRLAPVHAHLRYDAIAALETRLEAYPGLLGLTSMQRYYALRPKTGAVIILGEDRALATALESSRLAHAAEEIARRSGLEPQDRGMAEGRAGLLSVAFVKAPPWDGAPPVTPERQQQLWAAAAATGRLAGLAPFALLFNRRS